MAKHWLLILLLGLIAAHADAATLGALTIRVPQQWKRAGVSLSDSTREQTGLWRAADGRELQVNFWARLPPQPGGPLVVVRRSPIIVAGQKTELLETSLLQGHKAHARVVFLRRGDAHYRIVGRNISVHEFETILATVVFTK